LAARLSFIEEIEQDGAKTPLFLDEVLSTTDPVRFAAISSAVFELVKDGRQVFYATADRTEAQAWMEAAETQQVAQPQVKVLDGGLPESEWDEPPPLPNAVPEVPPPGESDAIEYMALLKLRRPRRYESVGAWPLGLVLYDDLDLVHQIFAAGLRTVSQLDYEQKGIPMPLTAAQLAVVRGRVTIIEAALEALQVGYNIPITWEAVEASKAITPGKREKTLASLELHSLDSKKFIEGCGLQKHKLPVLIEHLEPLGMVDLREALSEEEVRKRALLAGKKQLEDGLISLADVAALVELVQGVVVTP
jgi:hypothetical protein